MTAMHVFLTGVAGFIGSHVSEALVARGHRVTGYDSFDSYLYPAEIKRRTAEVVAARGVTVVEGDICNAARLASVLDESVDVVCHLAALAGVRPSLVEPIRYLNTNIVGTGVIVERMRALGNCRLVFASSSSVYGVKSGAVEDVVAFREDDPCLSPASPYASTKRMNELQLSTYRDLFGLGVHALRFFTVYGPRQRPDMAIAKFTQAIANDAPITLFGDGSSRRDYTFIEDIVAGVVGSIERVRPGDYELFNLGGTGTISLLELVGYIEQAVGRKATIRWAPDQPGDVPVTSANIDRARRFLGYEPTTRPDVGIQRYWEWYQER
jgi:UDP-glucuronate 4-epimerase